MEQALQWWYGQQSRQLSWEAAQIRDGLLQESFALRRSLELCQSRPDKSSFGSNDNWIEKFEVFYTYLQELSDRLCPPYLEEGLPLAIKYLIKKWQTDQPDCEFQLQLTSQWQMQLPEQDRLILNTIEQLLKLEIANFVNKAFIFLDLEQNEQDNQLKITIRPLKLDLNLDSIVSSHKSCDLEYLEYLSQSFRVLTSGTWITRTQKAETTYYLQWSRESREFN